MTDASAPAIVGQELDLSYTPAELQQKLLRYGLDTKHLLRKIRVNPSQIFRIGQRMSSLENQHFIQLVATLKTWQVPQDIEDLIININQLCYLWLNALKDGVSADSLMGVIQSLQLKHWGRDLTPQLQSMLFELLTESNQRYQAAQLDYVQNYDANTVLPRALQISSRLYVKSAESALALLSVQFQPVKHNLIFSNVETEHLNQSIAQILQQNIPQNAELFYGSNLQFDILVNSPMDISDINIVGAKLARAFEEMIFWGKQSILVMPYIGAHCGAIESPETCIAHAKLALESAITTQQYLVIYSNQLQEQVDAQSRLETQVLNAFAGDYLTLFMQPIMDIKKHRCVGAELLLRSPTLADYHIYPSHTIEILNKVGKGKLFTRWLINSACRIASELRQNHQLPIYLTINLRAEDLYDVELPLLLSQALALWQINAEGIVLEITENGILELNESSQTVIESLHTVGFKLALDDFGTGFSSLSRLRTMPIDLIKIDQSFVKNIARSDEDFKIVQSVASLASSLGKEVLAEGVEDEECLALIKKIKINKCQGYYYAKPMPFEEFVTWAKRI